MMSQRFIRGNRSAFFAAALAGFLLAASPIGVRAQETPEQAAGSNIEASTPAAPLTLGAALEEAHEANPSIAAARAEWKAAIEKYPQARAWPDPTLSFAFFPEPIETRLGANRRTDTLQFAIPHPAKLRLMGRKVEKMAEMARLKYEIAARDTLTDVKVSFRELQYINEAIALTQKNKELVEKLSQIADTDFGAGDPAAATYQETLRAQSQLAQVSYDLVLLEEIRQTEVANLNGLLNRPPDAPALLAPVADSEPVDLKLEDVYAAVEKRRQEIQMAQTKIESEKIGLDLARKQSKPNFMLGFTHNAIGTALNPGMKGSGDDAYGVMVGATLPIWFTKNASMAREAEAGVEAAQSNLSQMENMANVMASRIFFKLQTSRRLIELYENTLVPQARKSMEQAETWRKEGESSMSQTLETEAIWLNFELALARARADYFQNLARLEQAIGAPIETLTAKGEAK